MERSHGEEGIEGIEGHDLWYRPGPCRVQAHTMCCLTFGLTETKLFHFNGIIKKGWTERGFKRTP